MRLSLKVSCRVLPETGELALRVGGLTIRGFGGLLSLPVTRLPPWLTRLHDTFLPTVISLLRLLTTQAAKGAEALAVAFNSAPGDGSDAFTPAPKRQPAPQRAQPAPPAPAVRQVPAAPPLPQSRATTAASTCCGKGVETAREGAAAA